MNPSEISTILSNAVNYLMTHKTYVAAGVLVLLATYDIGTGQYRQGTLQIVAALAATGLQASITKETA